MPLVDPDEFGPPREARYWDPVDPYFWAQNPLLLTSSGPLAEDPRHRHRPRPRPAAQLPANLVIVPHWDDPEEGFLWDIITLGNYSFAGTVRIEGEGPRLSVDKRRKKGATFTKLIANGYDTAELKIILRVWDKFHLADFEKFSSEVHPKRNREPVALDVYHPELALAQIDKVLIYGVGFLKETGTPGLRECVLSCFEYTPESNKNATARVRHQPARVSQPELDPVFHTEHDAPLSIPTPSQTAANP